MAIPLSHLQRVKRECVINLWSEGRSEQLSRCTCSTSEQKERLSQGEVKYTDSVPPIWNQPFVLCIGGSRAAGEERGSSLSVRQRRCSSATLTVCRAQSPFDRDPRGVSPLSRRAPLQQKGKRNSWEDHLFHLRWPLLGEKKHTDLTDTCPGRYLVEDLCV